jgi:Site-specific recombinase XerD
MNKIKLTKTAVEKLPFAETGKQIDYLDADLDGFGIRVSATGKKYFVRRVVGGKRIRVMIGSHPVMTAESARSTARIKLGAMESGIDPNEVEREKVRKVVAARLEKEQAVTLEDALTDYLEKRRLKPKTRSVYRQMFHLHLADWFGLPVAEITGAMVAQRHTEIATGVRQRTALKKTVTTDKKNGKRGVEKVKAPETQRREASADGTMRVLRAVLNYTFGDDEDMGIVRINPVRTLSRKKSWYKVPRRRNLIKNSDLPAWSKAVMALENTVARDYLLFLLHTGLRRNEAARLQWQHIDFEERAFTIIDTKNKEPHTLPLSDYLRTLLEKRKECLKVELETAEIALEASKHSQEYLTPKQRQGFRNRVARAESRLQSPFVFPGDGKAGYISDPQKALEAVTQATGIIFSCHDLRRTFATIAESLDLSKYTIKALLNHKDQAGDVTGGYIILNVDRLRVPMQSMTDAIQERIKKPYGQVLQLQEGAV